MAAFGAVLVIAPDLARQAFGLLLFGDGGRIAAFGTEAAAYIGLAHPVMGSVLVGWGVAMWFVVGGPLARGVREAWTTIAVSIGAWFVPDTLFSLWSGAWPNALLNVGFLLAFAVPMAATRRSFERN